MRKILLVLFSLIFVSPAISQTANSFITIQKPQPAAVKFVQGTDTAGTYKTIYTGAANGSVCFNAVANSNDQSASHLVTIRYTTAAAVTYDFCTITVGNNGLAANLFGPAVGILVSNVCPMAISQAGNTYIQLKSGDLFQATFSTALTAADQINIVAQCGDY